jgi:hypothetical protein
MRRLTAAAGVLVLLAVAVAAIAATRSNSGKGNRIPPPATTPVPKPVAGPNIKPQVHKPRLTGHDRARTAHIVARDPKLKRILGGHAYSFKRIGLWTTARGTEVKIGSVAELAIKPPLATVVAEWPMLVYDTKERKYPPFRPKRVRLTVHNLKEVMINVDLRRGFLVSIEPGIGAGIETPPGSPPPQPPPGASD